jgi:hypothetical protein
MFKIKIKMLYFKTSSKILIENNVIFRHVYIILRYSTVYIFE